MIKAAFFDLGGTITNELCLALGPYYLGLKKEQDIIEDLYAKKEIKISDFIIKTINYWKGLSKDNVKEIVKNLTFIEGSEKLIKFLKEKNVRIIVIAKTPSKFLEVVSERVGFTDYYGTDAEVINNTFTGKLLNFPKSKGDSVDDYMKKQNLNKDECIAFGNDQSDLPMFEKVGFSISYKGINGAEIQSDLNVEDYEDAIKALEKFF